MSQKQIIIVISILVLACCCVTGLGLAGMWYAGDSFSRAIESGDDPESIARIADSIADYDPPPGYEQMAFDMFSLKYVFMFSQFADSPFIMLAQFPPALAGDQEEIREQMERSMAQQSGQGSGQMRAVEERAYTVRGQQVQGVIMEGDVEVEGGTVVMRQMILVFEGKSGVAALMFSGPQYGWDQEMIDAFIASIR
jgi:hypothetical protein